MAVGMALSNLQQLHASVPSEVAQQCAARMRRPAGCLVARKAARSTCRSPRDRSSKLETRTSQPVVSAAARSRTRGRVQCLHAAGGPGGQHARPDPRGCARTAVLADRAAARAVHHAARLPRVAALQVVGERHSDPDRPTLTSPGPKARTWAVASRDSRRFAFLHGAVRRAPIAGSRPR